ncbi:MFS transporter [Enterococcus faecalis]
MFIAGSIELCYVGVVSSMASIFRESLSVMGLTITVYSLAFAILGPICMKIFRNINYKIIFIGCLITISLGNLFSVFTLNIYLFLFYRILIGTASSILISKSISLASLLSSEKNLDSNLGVLYTAFAGANTFAIPVFSYFGNRFAWKTIPIMIALTAIIITLIFLLSVPKDYQGIEQTIIPSKKVSVSNNIEPIKVLLTSVIILCSNMTFIGYLNPYMEKEGFIQLEITIALFIFGIGGILGSYLSPRLTKKHSIKSSLILLLSIYALILLVIQLNSYKSIFFVLMFTWSAVQWATGPLLQKHLVTQTKKDNELFISLNVASINVGAALGSLLGGIIISVIPLKFLPLCAMFIVCIALLLVASYKEIGLYEEL